MTKSARLTCVLAAALVPLVAPGTSASADEPAAVVCTTASEWSYSPGVVLLPRPLRTTVKDTYTACTGVGGAVADAIGQRLKRLSARVQVLSVTHAPQVAARADTHLLISKGPSGDDKARVATRVATMGDRERREEIARMLAGASITEEARAAAGKLLAGEG